MARQKNGWADGHSCGQVQSFDASSPVLPRVDCSIAHMRHVSSDPKRARLICYDLADEQMNGSVSARFSKQTIGEPSGASARLPVSDSCAYTV